jgi:large subunit ribosomal protein L32
MRAKRALVGPEFCIQGVLKVLAIMAAIIPRQFIAFSSAFFSLSSSAIFGSSWSIPLLPSLRDLIPPFLLAVPKKKVSHSRKAMRSANKGLKDKQSG